MYTVDQFTQHTLHIQKSVFITSLYKIHTKDEAHNCIKEARKKYKDATHICFAYKIDSHIKCSDDGEPTGTAGIPILHILDQKKMNYILCVVIRYFGGIKLGTGGLIRAYGNCVKEALLHASIIKMTQGLKLEIIFCYNMSKYVNFILKNYLIYDKQFGEMITYYIDVEIDKKDALEQQLNGIVFSIIIIQKIWIEKIM